MRRSTTTRWRRPRSRREDINGGHHDESRGVRHQRCGILGADDIWVMSHSKEHLKQMMKEFIKEAKRWDLEPKLASFWWSTHADESKEDMTMDTTKDGARFPSRKASLFWSTSSTRLCIRRKVSKLGGEQKQRCFSGGLNAVESWSKSTAVPSLGAKAGLGVSRPLRFKRKEDVS